ncbi:hypothetical protein DFR33_102421 [Bradymonas sediminis]|nr:hypothetical protein DFR33_102421 [Bradymonas sediminis]
MQFRFLFNTHSIRSRFAPILGPKRRSRNRLAKAAVLVGVGLCVGSPSSATAQQSPGAENPGWVRTFDDVSVRHIKPEDLPEASEPGAAIGLLRTSSKDLPRHASQEDLQKLAEKTNARVMRIVAVQIPPRPYRQVPMLFFGHALWVSPPALPDTADTNPGSTTDSGANPGRDSNIKSRYANRVTRGAAREDAAPPVQRPVLISSLDWLSTADQVYALPHDISLDDEKKQTSKHVKKADDSAASWRATRRSLEQLTAGTGGEKWLKKHKDKLIELSPLNPDRHRNLVQLKSADARLAPPASGFELFDTANQALFKLYGYSPYAGKFLTNTMLYGSHPENPALTFYWQTNYAAILGAPLIAEDGKLVSINTTQHPDDTQIFLSVPTDAIASYLRQHRASKDAKAEEKE